MKTSLDCIPCFYKQALYTARLCSKDRDFHSSVLAQISCLLNNLDLSISPPENSVAVYQEIARLTKVSDPFRPLKRMSNDTALELRPHIIGRIDQAEDPLLAAIKFAIAGNIIDYGSHQEFDIDKTLQNCLLERLAINDYEQFCHDLAKANNILYLADNCGEIVFDGILIEKLNKTITLAVKERPIINDALFEDAIYCGLDNLSTVISNGTGCPGTPIDNCSKDFKEIFHAADLIISKGQGNFETLSEIEKPIYFLLQVKCPIVGKHIEEISSSTKQIKTGDMIFMKKRGKAGV